MELLPLALGQDGIELYLLKGLTLQVGWHARKHPNEVACALAEEFGLTPVIAHSTSWRHEPAKLIVTYAAVVDPPDALPPMLTVQPVRRAELARGTATAAPKVLDVAPIVEHALRHLSWLQRDDEHIRGALSPAWTDALAPYPPEPFRPFEGDWGQE